MKQLNDEYKERLRDKIIEEAAKTPLNEYLGIEMVELDEKHGIGRVKNRPEVLNPFGSYHGGALLAFADVVAGVTGFMISGCYVTTISQTLNFMLPAMNTEYVYCEAKVLRAGKHIQVFEVKITDDDGKLLDSGEYSFFLTNRRVLDE